MSDSRAADPFGLYIASTGIELSALARAWRQETDRLI